jgi:preprotein translocase subunit SecG
MSTVVLIIHLFLAMALIGVVLLQRSEGGALGMGGGGAGGGFGGILSGRGAGNVLTRTTAILAACFFVTSITLALLASTGRQGGSILDTPSSQPTSPTPAPIEAPTTGAPSAPASSLAPPTTGAAPPATTPATEPAPAPATESPAPEGSQPAEREPSN